MARITIDDEQALRSEIVTDLNAIEGIGFVFDRRRKFTSRTDFLARTKTAIGSGSSIAKFVRFAELELSNIEDSPDEGFDDCPVAILTYTLHIFHEFADELPGGSNSDKDFNQVIFALRDRFLSKRRFASGLALTDAGITPIDGTDFSQFGADPFTEIVGHSKDLLLKVNYYDEAN